MHAHAIATMRCTGSIGRQQARGRPRRPAVHDELADGDDADVARHPAPVEPDERAADDEQRDPPSTRPRTGRSCVQSETGNAYPSSDTTKPAAIAITIAVAHDRAERARDSARPRLVGAAAARAERERERQHEQVVDDQRKRDADGARRAEQRHDDRVADEREVREAHPIATIALRGASARRTRPLPRERGRRRRSRRPRRTRAGRRGPRLSPTRWRASALKSSAGSANVATKRPSTRSRRA
jgi:hypothetical protein